MQVNGLVLYCNAVIDVAHLITYRMLVGCVAPLVVHNELELVRARNEIEAHHKLSATPS